MSRRNSVEPEVSYTQGALPSSPSSIPTAPPPPAPPASLPHLTIIVSILTFAIALVLGWIRLDLSAAAKEQNNQKIIIHDLVSALDAKAEADFNSFCSINGRYNAGTGQCVLTNGGNISYKSIFQVLKDRNSEWSK
jgi:hypothetical protein